MRSGRSALSLLLVLLVHTAAPRAEMDGADYASDRALATAAERQRAQERIAAERRAEAERAAARAAESMAKRAREAEAYARRPIGERLMMERCGACHALDGLAAIRHTLPGWHLVIARMRVWNGADIGFSEARVIAAHLATHQPARGMRRALELLALSMPAWLAIGIVWWRRRTR